MYILRYQGMVRKTVVVAGIGNVFLIPECMIRIDDERLLTSFMSLKKTKFSVVNRPALPDEKPTYEYDENLGIGQVVEDPKDVEPEDDEESDEETDEDN